ncbi:TPA: hypothetical protein U7I90_000992 [Streptococcus agalactiae]|nr:hypothetical protein [Streptococcus agalactiae]
MEFNAESSTVFGGLTEVQDAVSAGLNYVSEGFGSFNGTFDTSGKGLDWTKIIKTGMEVRKEAKEVSIKKTKNTVENINKVERGLSYGSTANVMCSEAVGAMYAGAAFGSMIPIPVVGTLAGAVVGYAIGGLANTIYDGIAHNDWDWDNFALW